MSEKSSKKEEFKHVSAFLATAAVFTVVFEVITTMQNDLSMSITFCGGLGTALGFIATFAIVYETYKPYLSKQ